MLRGVWKVFSADAMPAKFLHPSNSPYVGVWTSMIASQATVRGSKLARIFYQSN